MTGPIVFVGPSLRPEDRSAVGSIEFCPPAAQGDILRAIARRPKAIGLVDGYFGDRLAVHQKEILEAIAEGIPVLGAASMGALRAAELHSYGMEGVGKIFEDYVNGVLTSDADVAISHGPEKLGFMPTSISLVDVRATTEALKRQSFLNEVLLDDILKAAEAIHFKERTWSRITKALAIAPVESARIARALREGHVELKRHDANELVMRLRENRFVGTRHSFPPPMTSAYSTIRRRALQDTEQCNPH